MLIWCAAVFQIRSAVTPDRRNLYRSSLIRYWASAQPAPGNGSRGRFVVERIAGDPQRWGFDSFDDLVAFLRVALLEDESGQRNGMPPSNGC